MRFKIFFTAIVLSYTLIFAGLFYTEIVKGPYYKTLSEKNRIIGIPLDAPRGIIFDRSGKIVVANRASFDAALIYGDTKDAEKISTLLSRVLKLDRKDLNERINRARMRPFMATVIAADISREEAIILEQYRIDYPGLIVTSRPKRDYPYGTVGSPVIGYLGRINEDEISRFKTYGYRTTDLVGKSGIEKEYDSYLKGQAGGMQVEADSLGRQKDVLRVKEPKPGKNLALTIDMELQSYCDELMKDRKGCIIVMNPKSGGVLTMVSKPDFDPSFFVKPAMDDERMDLIWNQDNDYPLLNRAISCAYPPGSVFKNVVAVAALESRNFRPEETFNCGGSFSLGKHVSRCWKEEGHGTQRLEEGIKNSCNVFFYQLGLRAGADPITAYAKKLGFGRLTGIDLPGEIKGLVPSRQWKMAEYGSGWYPGDTVNFSIGQGYLLVTPIQIIRMMAAIANGGYLVKPYLVSGIDNVSLSNEKIEETGIREETLALVKKCLKKVVNDPDGTGRKARLDDVVVAGKTGTAQTAAGLTHGWFCGFAPFEEPRISVLVFVEFGGKGGLEASMIARNVIIKTKDLGII